MGLRLGQHFLKSGEILKRIISALDLKGRDFVVEIGPGHGELTRYLVESGATVIAIEKDKRLVEYLSKKFEARSAESETISKSRTLNSKLNVIEGDALEVLPNLTHNSQLTTHDWKLVGNIPYYITGHLLRIIGDLEQKPSLTILLIQKEVAKRICARPLEMTRSKNSGSSRASRGMNLLAASVQFWAEPGILFYVKKGNFNPPPKIDSAVIKLETKDIAGYKVDTNKYYSFTKKLFKQPRKTILNNLLAGGYEKEKIIKVLSEVGINPTNRPQNLSLDDIIHISLLL